MPIARIERYPGYAEVTAWAFFMKLMISMMPQRVRETPYCAGP